jgi:catecholate siderophore receptor
VQKTKIAHGANLAADGSDQLTYTPKDAFSLWSTYRLPFGLTVGGGARYSGGLKRGTDGAVGTPNFTESFWVFDAMASYQVNKNVDIQLNVYNLFDKEYVAAINKSGYRYFPGIPRSARVTANFRF